MISRRAALGLLMLPSLARAATADIYPPDSIKALDRNLHEFTVFGDKQQLYVLHIWATWCNTCREELAALASLNRQVKDDGIAIAAIAIDRMGWGVIEKTIASIDTDGLLIAQDPNRELSGRIKARGLPTTVILSPEGRELHRIEGARDWQSAEFVAFLKAFRGS